MSEPTSPLAVSKYIGQTLRRKRELLDTLHETGVDARAKRAAATRAESRAFLEADGAMEVRKHKSRVDPVVIKYQDEADVSEELVKHLTLMVKHCGDELDGARTAAATLRAEFTVMGLSDEGH